MVETILQHKDPEERMKITMSKTIDTSISLSVDGERSRTSRRTSDLRKRDGEGQTR
jgi:hypothetical protein